jgi:hypothetical protein
MVKSGQVNSEKIGETGETRQYADWKAGVLLGNTRLPFHEEPFSILLFR